ncbi:glutamine-fructose-6-phosphate transaminase [Mycobacterium xenopi 4042]|uniref:Glutamine--fructose-6-phosphate aminotransferase [isomerizing] n=1 Tax=Mycobacterium xenopi 4042 TaxID=1299334 RepID=X7YJY1_MYCXE|nr:glutamine-fructose-6-phosphate transaminase [Mycobacterium xenopi 4042]
MCGIVGYVGQRSACDVVVDALRRMEYRGYDSAGIALLDGHGKLTVRRRAGRLSNLEKALEDTDPAALSGNTGLGHTRWATHGRPTDRNAHPHSDAAGKIAVVHNGIIENFAVLRRELEAAGVEFASDTDTEVAVHLVAQAYRHGETAGDFVGSVLAVLRRLEGHFTLVFANADEPGTIVAARRSTPLVVGIGDGEMFIGSDVAAFIEHTRDAVELGQDQAVVITAEGYRISDFYGNDVTGEARAFHIDWDLSAAEKGGYEYFMLKEIAEQPAAVADTLLGHFVDGRIVLDEQRLSDQELREIDKVFVVACGTAYHSGLLAKYAIEHWTRLPVEVELASEFRYRDPVLDRSTLVVAISQSGKPPTHWRPYGTLRNRRPRYWQSATPTARKFRGNATRCSTPEPGPRSVWRPRKRFWRRSPPTICLGWRSRRPGHKVSRRGRTRIPRAGIHAGAGGPRTRHDGTGCRAGLSVRRVVDHPVPRAPRRLPSGAGRRVETQGTGVHARRGLRRRELKHGPIALIEDDLPVIVVMPSPKNSATLHAKLLSNIREIQTRGAITIVIAEEGDETVRPFADHLIEIPSVSTLFQPLLSTIPLQVFAASVARARGYDVDKPRNLAKSVTVE